MVKEVQLSPRIDPHDLSIKIQHAIGFLCEDMKVKVVLKFRGREMAHQEFGFEVTRKFLAAVAPYGHPDFEPKLIGRGINAMISPLPRNKRAKTPNAVEGGSLPAAADNHPAAPPQTGKAPVANEPASDGFVNNPFAKLEVK
jgi:translation initiation factor IF-3